MRLLDWLRRRRPQARTPSPRAGSSASPSEDYSATTVLHTADSEHAVGDAARRRIDPGRGQSTAAASVVQGLVFESEQNVTEA
jgi:hypothetical protein